MHYLIQVKEADGTWFRIASFSTRLTRDGEVSYVQNGCFNKAYFLHHSKPIWSDLEGWWSSRII